MATDKAPFEWGKTAKSAGKAGGITIASVGPTLIAFATFARAMGVDLWNPEQDAEIIGALTVLSGAVATLWGTGKNLVSNWHRPSAPKALPLWLLVPIAALVLQGCGTLAPAVYGKTRYDMTFGDKLGPVEGSGGQDTTFSVHVVAPAGVKLEDLVSMNYDWNADQSGKIAVSKNATTDTTGQTEVIKAAIEAHTQAFMAGVSIAGNFATAALPIAGGLIGQHMEIQGAQAATDAANRQALRQQLIPIIDERLGQAQTQQNAIWQEIIQRLGRLESTQPNVTPPTPTP